MVGDFEHIKTIVHHLLSKFWLAWSYAPACVFYEQVL